MYNLVKSYNRRYYRNKAAINIKYRYFFFKIRIWKLQKIARINIAGYLTKLACWISPDFKAALFPSRHNHCGDL